MRMAYDTIPQSEVSAELAAQNSGFEPYRYECICCGGKCSLLRPTALKWNASETVLIALWGKGEIPKLPA